MGFALEVRIWTSRLGFGPQGWEMGFEAAAQKHRSLTPSGLLLNFHHNLLRQGMGIADHLTLLRLLLVTITASYQLPVTSSGRAVVTTATSYQLPVCSSRVAVVATTSSYQLPQVKVQ